MMKVSIVLPLIDRRDLGWGALASAVGQEGRASVDVVVVLGPEIAQYEDRDPELAALLGHADALARLPESGDVVANEIIFYDAGARRATGHAKFNYYQALAARGEDLRRHVRHPVYLFARRCSVAADSFRC